jgi:hypothetical protein
VHRGVPPAVPRHAAPRPVGPLSGEQLSACPLGGDPRALGCDLLLGRTDQISHRLPADRRVRIEQPLYGRTVWLGDLPIADDAIEFLHGAVAKGFQSVPQLKSDPDLDPLHSREDFQELVQEVEQKGKT